MKQFKIKAIIPASRVETFVIEANTPDEAYEKWLTNNGKLITSETTLHREDTECDYPQEI
jgi:hypothetical protein